MIRTAIEIAATPTAYEVIELYLGFSPHSTAANGNPGGLSGSDGAFAGYNSNLAEAVKHLQGPFPFICTDDPTTYVQVSDVGILIPTDRYVMCVLKNESGAAIHSDDVECHIVLDPIIPEFQDA